MNRQTQQKTPVVTAVPKGWWSSEDLHCEANARTEKAEVETLIDQSREPIALPSIDSLIEL